MPNNLKSCSKCSNKFEKLLVNFKKSLNGLQKLLKSCRAQSIKAYVSQATETPSAYFFNNSRKFKPQIEQACIVSPRIPWLLASIYSKGCGARVARYVCVRSMFNNKQTWEVKTDDKQCQIVDKLPVNNSDTPAIVFATWQQCYNMKSTFRGILFHLGVRDSLLAYTTL